MNTWEFWNTTTLDTDDLIEFDCEGFEEATTLLSQQTDIDPTEWELFSINGNIV